MIPRIAILSSNSREIGSTMQRSRIGHVFVPPVARPYSKLAQLTTKSLCRGRVVTAYEIQQIGSGGFQRVSEWSVANGYSA